MSASDTRRLSDPKYLVGHWPLAGHPNDVSGHGFNGTLVNSPTYTASLFGRQCLALNGTTQSVRVGDITQLDGAAQLSFSCWLSQDNIASAQDRIFERAAGLNGFLAHTATSTFVMYVMSGVAAYSIFNYPSGWTNSTWVHLCIVYDGTQATAANRVRLHVNTQEITAASTVGTFPTTLGSAAGTIATISGNTGNYGFGGKLSACRLYLVALTGAEIRALYLFELGGGIA